MIQDLGLGFVVGGLGFVVGIFVLYSGSWLLLGLGSLFCIDTRNKAFVRLGSTRSHGILPTSSVGFARGQGLQSDNALFTKRAQSD
jgi:hypothetical protein